MKNERSNRKEIEEKKRTSYDYVILRPGGNDTCLVMVDVLPSIQKRKELNDILQTQYDNVEQVGFIKKGLSPQLMMAGGEFCGNATRSAAWQYLQGLPGEIEISVSGVEKSLKAGVTENGEAFAQMPIYPEISKVKKENATDYIVEMEGITHYIAFGDNCIDILSQEEIKNKAFDKLKEKQLDQCAAAGVMYVSKCEDGIKIDPIVYVRDIDTLYYETACGSGTTAVGMALAIISGGSIQNLPIKQPSGINIDVSIDYDGKTFSNAQIQGQLSELYKGNVETIEGEKIFTEKVDSSEKVKKALNNGNLFSLYNDVFGKPPYNETFTDDEIKKIFKEYASNGLLYLSSTSEEVIGFGAAVPLEDIPELTTVIKETTIDTRNTWYMADLGVKEEYRRKGIAKKLVIARLNALQKGTTAIMRTSVNNLASQSLYTSLGFTQIPDIYQEVEQTRTDGSIQKDKRLFFKKEI